MKKSLVSKCCSDSLLTLSTKYKGFPKVESTICGACGKLLDVLKDIKVKE